ncbi:hypothetical protein PLAN_70105 [Planktothrix rubescens CCAP 1459/22]|uniref:Uncharacterized protein n=1 Tax=Planktothrix rubescens CCAP 1459/22 TaxID=329571 RepID=A0A6J7ZUA3_PLARU|nr:hypothetical protein PLAN_70105 [Planktothrix rubescens NIVA-CYA 18]
MYRRPELELKWLNLSRTDYQVTSPKSQEFDILPAVNGRGFLTTPPF